MAMANVVKKKKNRRLKRSVRRTLGTLFLVSALAVAAIPTEGLQSEVQAGDTTTSVYKSDLNWETQKNGAAYTSAIPLITNTAFADIYTDETGKFQFAWLDSLKGKTGEYKGGSEDPSGAMILRYEGGTSDGGTLVIPEKVSAFASYATNQGANDVAVSQSHEILYYMSTEYRINTHTEEIKDSEGKVVDTKVIYDGYQAPAFDLCQRSEIGSWQWKEVNAETHTDKNGRTREQYMRHDFYYRLATAPPSDAGFTYNIIDSENDGIFYTTEGGKNIYNEKGKDAAESDSAVFKVGNYYYVRVGDVSRGHQWICNQTVKYIGNQFLTPLNKTDTATGIIQRFAIAEATPNKTPGNGVFAGNTNIYNLQMSDEVLGVGNYAFYGTAVQSVTFGNGLVEIGHDAFANSSNLRDVTIPFYSNLATISDCAFANTNIVGFILPYSVREIYDSAFEGCKALAEVRFNAEGQERQWLEKWNKWGDPVVTLNNIGCSVFKDCKDLKEITLPDSLGSAKIHLDIFQGCSSLERVVVSNADTEFVGHEKGAGAGNPSDAYTVETFKNDVSKQDAATGKNDIYFEAPGVSKTHDFTKKNGIAFKYTDGNRQFEVIKEVGEGSNKVQLTYQAVKNGEIGELYDFEMSGKLNGKAVEIPSKIGPVVINSIGAGCFGDTGNLEKIKIPGTISAIGDGAFKGCGNLKHVIFDDAVSVMSIGQEAFRTQVPFDAAVGSNAVSAPSLTFTGAIAANDGAGSVTAPFAYAMKQGDYAKGNNEISNDSQAHTYITYYSGWPALLEVKYNPETGKSMLADYPTVKALKDGKYIEKDTINTSEYKYPFMEEDYVEAITVALKSYYNISSGSAGPDSPSEEASGYAEALNNNLKSIVLPYGVESIKPKLFVDSEREEIGGPDADSAKPEKQLTAYGLKEVEDGAFQGFMNLKSVSLADSTKTLGAYAFDGCTGLTSATLPMTLEEIGLRPFKECEKISAVNFKGNPKFTVVENIIYETDTNGNKVAVVECLEGRTKSVTKTELAGIQNIYREAFMNSKVLSVDLSTSYITKVPEYAFAYTSLLSSVTLPGTVSYVDPNAFKNSAIKELYIPSVDTQVDPLAMGDGIYYDESNPSAAEAFWQTTHGYQNPEDAKSNGVGVWTQEKDYGYSHTLKNGDLSTEGSTNLADLVLYCENDSNAKKNFADRYQIQTSDDFDKTYVVNFYDEDGVTKLTETQTVPKGESADIPDMTGRVNANGEVFRDWQPTTADPGCIMANTDFTAYYGNPDNCTITFWKDWEKKEPFSTVTVPKGTTKAELEASGQIPVEKVDAYAASINKRFVSWMDMPEVFDDDANPYAMYDARKWTVTFVDRDDPTKVFATQQVLDGDNATDFVPVKEGFEFNGWLDSLENIKSDRTIRALFLPKSLTNRHTVTFYKDDGTVYKTQQVPDGEDAVEIAGPVKEGYTFTGWQPAANLLKVTRDVDVTAMYSQNSGGSGNGSGTASGNGSGNGNGNNGGNSGGNSTASGNGSGGNGTASGNGSASSNSSKFYTLTVKNGSGSGSYAVGSQPIIIADDPAAGYEFSHWTIDPEKTVIASKVLSASVITMPASNVTVTAHYKAKTGSSSGGGTSASGNSNRPNGSTGTVTNGGTTVVIDKNGLSNTGVVSAVVNGSSDNFVIKITDSSTATEAILRALMAEYGNDLSNIKYFPMDISLYDSTGTTKITDTTGLRISVTLPLPDSLIPYAGNNKVAGVVNERLDKLAPRFTTIDGVSCVTFVAEHFSPYVIYVDTSRLSDGTLEDDTPKTGDGIHPKWFLSIGLACLSFIMFMQKDNKKKEKVKVKARA